MADSLKFKHSLRDEINTVLYHSYRSFDLIYKQAFEKPTIKLDIKPIAKRLLSYYYMDNSQFRKIAISSLLIGVKSKNFLFLNGDQIDSLKNHKNITENQIIFFIFAFNMIKYLICINNQKNYNLTDLFSSINKILLILTKIFCKKLKITLFNIDQYQLNHKCLGYGACAITYQTNEEFVYKFRPLYKSFNILFIYQHIDIILSQIIFSENVNSTRLIGFSFKDKQVFLVYKERYINFNGINDNNRYKISFISLVNSFFKNQKFQIFQFKKRNGHKKYYSYDENMMIFDYDNGSHNTVILNGKILFNDIKIRYLDSRFYQILLKNIKNQSLIKYLLYICICQ